jgi:hypothetical protein
MDREHSLFERIRRRLTAEGTSLNSGVGAVGP